MRVAKPEMTGATYNGKLSGKHEREHSNNNNNNNLFIVLTRRSENINDDRYRVGVQLYTCTMYTNVCTTNYCTRTLNAVLGGLPAPNNSSANQFH